MLRAKDDWRRTVKILHTRLLRRARLYRSGFSRLRVAGVELVFATDDPVARKRFYPDYEQGRVFEPGLTGLLAARLPTSRCFVDVGAFLGYYTCLASKLMPDDALIHSFEIDPINYTLLRRNVSLNATHADVFVHNVGIADYTGLGHYRRGHDRFGAENKLVPDEESSGIAAPVTSLDDFFATSGPPDIVKIDVEGGELRVLLGMARLLSDARIQVCVEVHGATLLESGGSAAKVLELLRDAGLRVWHVKDFRRSSSLQLAPVAPENHPADDFMVYAHGRAIAPPLAIHEQRSRDRRSIEQPRTGPRCNA